MYRFYLKNTRRCNNWDLVDLSCRDIVGEYLVNRDRSVLYELAASDNLWEQRIRSSVLGRLSAVRILPIRWRWPNG